jgi:hypothetical protein
MILSEIQKTRPALLPGAQPDHESVAAGALRSEYPPTTTVSGWLAFTLLRCCTDLEPPLFLSAPCEAAMLEDGIRDHYVAATGKTR